MEKEKLPENPQDSTTRAENVSEDAVGLSEEDIAFDKELEIRLKLRELYNERTLILSSRETMKDHAHALPEINAEIKRLYEQVEKSKKITSNKKPYPIQWTKK